MATVLWEKDPDDNKDYWLDWTGFMPSNDPITGHEVTLAPGQPPGLVIGTNTHNASGVTVWLSGGVLGVIYELVIKVTTNDGRVGARRVMVDVKTMYADAA